MLTIDDLGREQVCIEPEEHKKYSEFKPRTFFKSLGNWNDSRLERRLVFKHGSNVNNLLVIQQAYRVSVSTSKTAQKLV